MTLRLRIANLSTEVLGATEAQEALIADRLAVKQPRRWFSSAYQSRRWDGLIHAYSLRTHKFPTGHLPAVLELAAEQGWTVAHEDARVQPALVNRELHDVVLRDYQADTVTKAILRRVGDDIFFPRGIVWIPTRGGKCLGAGTEVMLYSGVTVRAEDVEVGDLLMGPDSRPRRVLTTSRGRGKCFEITSCAGRSWVCNEDHVLTLRRTGSGEVVDIPLTEYREANKTFHHEYKQFSVGVDFPDPCRADRTVDPYFLGVWLGDGHKDLHTVDITKPDPEIKALAHDTARAWGLTVTTQINSSGCPTYSLVLRKGAKNPLLDALRGLGLAKDRLRIPRCYRTGPREVRQALLAGLLDTDGYLDPTKQTYEIVQRERPLAEDIAFVARSLGLRATVNTKSVNGFDYTRVYIGGDASALPLRIARKRAKAIARDRRVAATNTGFEVRELAGEHDYFGFELDEDGRFLLGDFTVTHNSPLIARFAAIVGGPVLILVHREQLLEQLSTDLACHLGEPIGIIGDGEIDLQRVTVGMVKTAVSRRKQLLPYLPTVQGLYCDEVHRLVSGEALKLIKIIPAYFRIGVSATPYKKDDPIHHQRLTGAFGPLLHRVEDRPLVERGIIAPVRLQFRKLPTVTHVELDGVPHKTWHLPWEEAYLHLIVRNPARNADVCAWAQESPAPTVIIIRIVEHGERLAQMLGCPFIFGDTPTAKRQAIVKQMNARKLRYLVASTVFDEGLHLPVCHRVGNAAAGLSDSQFLQRLGRGRNVEQPGDWLDAADWLDACNKHLVKHTAARIEAANREGFQVSLAQSAALAHAS